MSNTISIIIPVYNEKESLEELYGEIRAATGSFSKREVLFIDDSPQHIQRAKKLGIQTYHLKDDEEIITVFPDIVQ